VNRKAPELREYVADIVLDNVNQQLMAAGKDPINEITDFSELFITVLTDPEEGVEELSSSLVFEVDGRVTIPNTGEKYLVYVREVGQEAAAVASDSLTKELQRKE